jgi:hypothetical protein
MIFHYISEIVANNIVPQCLLENKRFFPTVKERRQSILEDLRDNKQYNEELKALVYNILIKNQEILDQKFAL